ncbi:hypothetical protein K1T71_013131 [Dendrolimus kikuchii]|uniref:Uncharacterized protein n=1 Tax=Dendrolimus kikuchii TaxID=765133 RepID=A0ACC1CJ41_9NEOP|nr:hypothetical protein K1T71_013131 [Dendrolimus kikuchii]
MKLAVAAIILLFATSCMGCSDGISEDDYYTCCSSCGVDPCWCPGGVVVVDICVQDCMQKCYSFLEVILKVGSCIPCIYN